jgi:hypothetical protein
VKQLLFLILILLTLVGCGASAEPTASPIPPTPTPSPQDWLISAAEAWNKTESFHFKLDLENRTLSLDENLDLEFANVEGDVAAPDSLRANTVVKTLFGNFKANFISIGEEQWLWTSLSKKWEKNAVTLETAVTDLFDQEIGIGTALTNMSNLERLDDQSLDGSDTVYLRGNLPGLFISDFAPELANTEKVDVDLWISKADQRIQKILITEPPLDNVSSTWTFLFSQYDSISPIEPPS